MEELIAIIFGILIFVGPIILRFIGSLFDDSGSAAKQVPKSTANQRSEFAEQLRRHRDQQRQVLEPVEAEIIADAVPIRSLSDSSQNTSDAFYNEKQHLADAIQTRDDQMDNRLHRVFDHSLGGLDTGSLSVVQEDVLGTEQAAAAAQPSLAAGIVSMLQNTQDVRRAFILGEILQRPAHFDRR